MTTQHSPPSRGANLAQPRVHRRGGATNETLTNVDIFALEESIVDEKFDWEKLTVYLPLALSVLWIMIGTIFYAVHDNLGWARALFTSVNVGWSIGWPMSGLSEFDSPLSKFFTIYHTSIGVLFDGLMVLYIAQEVGKNKDNWIVQVIKMKELNSSAEVESVWSRTKSLVKVHYPSLRIIAVCFMWFVFGLLWFPFTNTEYTVAKNFDFMYSTLTAGGYLSLPSSISAYQLIITALYSNYGVPLLTVALGLLLSLVMEDPADDLIFHQIIAPVSEEEIKFMQEFGMENGDGVVDCKEFIILAVVRIGAVNPELMRRINERFKQLDRKRTGKLLHDDLVVDRVSDRIVDAISNDGDDLDGLNAMRRRNSNIFLSRAKNVFDNGESSASAEVVANLARIKSFKKCTPSTADAVARSTRPFIPVMQATTESKSNGDNDDDGNGEEMQGVKEEDDNMVTTNRNVSQGSKRKRSSKDLEIINNRFYSRSNSGKYGEDDVNESRQRTSSALSATFTVEYVLAAEDGYNKINENDVEENHSDMSGLTLDDMYSSKNASSGMSSRSSRSSRKIYPDPALTFDSIDQDDSDVVDLEAGIDKGCDSVALLSEGSSVYIISPTEADASIEEHPSSMETPHLQNLTAKDNFKRIVRKQQQENRGYKTVADLISKVVAENQAAKSKHHAKLEQIQKAKRQSMRMQYKNRKKNPWERRLVQVSTIMKSSGAIACYVWLLWLTAGTIFYTLEENLTVCKGFFVSASVGYGIFWYSETSTNAYAKVFSTIHFSIGVFGVALTMALFARSLQSGKHKWYIDVKQKRSMKVALASKENLWDSFMIVFRRYWPKVYVHVYFLVWMLLGIVWGMASIKWSVLDAWLFAMTAMSTGGLVSLPSSGVHEWDYFIAGVYIIIGAPLMAISCGISAHNISTIGRAAKMERLINASVREDEWVMLKHLGIDDGDGSMDEGGFAILILVRIGALNPGLIEVLLDRYHEMKLNAAGTVTYETLRKDSFIGNAKMLMPVSFKKSFTRSFSSSFKGSKLINKLRLDSMGT